MRVIWSSDGGEQNCFLDALIKRLSSIHLILLLIAQAKSASVLTLAEDKEYPSPHSVQLVSQTDSSLTITWEVDATADNSPEISFFTVHFYSLSGSEKVENVSSETRNKLIHNLQPATEYTVYVTAHYSGNKSASSMKCVMSTRESASNSIYKDCSCFPPGTKHCDREINEGKCICHTGYEGFLCDACKEGFYQSGNECKPCPCSPETSHGTCQLGTELPGEVTCTCHEGYFGPLCDSCVIGFYPVANDRCVRCHCLLCWLGHASHHDAAACSRCPSYAGNITDQTAVEINCKLNGPRIQHRKKDHGDGTVAIVAAVASLGFIACVAAGVTCYRRRLQARNQPPFWSIELSEDKITLNGSSSEYERLGEGSSKQHFRTSHQRSPSVAEATAAQRAANQPQYNCISI